MASYPTSVKTFTSVVNGITKLVAALFNSPYDEITAIETDILSSAVAYDATSTVVGWTGETPVIFYKKVGKLVFVSFNIQGTSDTTTATFTLPYTNANTTAVVSCVVTGDNGTYTTGGGQLYLPVSDNTVAVFKDMAQAAFTASGTKTIRGQFFYEATS